MRTEQLSTQPIRRMKTYSTSVNILLVYWHCFISIFLFPSLAAVLNVFLSLENLFTYHFPEHSVRLTPVRVLHV